LLGIINIDERCPSPPLLDKRDTIPNEKVNQLVAAVNDGNAERAAKIARELAQSQQSIRFALDMINESGNAPSRLPPEPPVKPLKYLSRFELISLVVFQKETLN